MSLLERAARWYLHSRGYLTYQQPFMGMLIGGHALALKVEADEFSTHDKWEVYLPRHCFIYAVNQSIVDSKHTKFMGTKND